MNEYLNIFVFSARIALSGKVPIKHIERKFVTQNLLKYIWGMENVYELSCKFHFIIFSLAFCLLSSTQREKNEAKLSRMGRKKNKRRKCDSDWTATQLLLYFFQSIFFLFVRYHKGLLRHENYEKKLVHAMCMNAYLYRSLILNLFLWYRHSGTVRLIAN